MDYLKFSAYVKLVKSRSDILQIFSKYTTLRENGKVYVGKCPLHEDDGESLTLNPNEGIYYCYGCHAGGDVFNFVARAENLSLEEAVKLQANFVGVDINSPNLNLDDERSNIRNRALLEVNDYARDFYHELLTKTDEGESCRKYLQSRGITKREIGKFQLGFAPNVIGKLAAYLEDYGFKFELILQAGLVDATPEGFLDKFQDCVTIPILNQFGQTTALIGQISDFEKKFFYETEGLTTPYIFPKDGPIFNKSQLIFGLNEARNFIVKSNFVIVVENCLDAICLAGAGVENVVATFDKTLTQWQAEKLTLLTKKIIFCLKDGDTLPIDEETTKSLSLNKASFFIVVLPNNPYEYVNENGKDIFLQALENAIPFKEYKFLQTTYEKLEKKKSLATENQSADLIKYPPIVPKLGMAILKMACRDPAVFRYVKAVIPMNIFSEQHQKAIEYLKICLDENSPPDKEGAAIFFEGNIDKDFLDILNIMEKGAPLNDIERLAFEDALEYLLKRIRGKDLSDKIADALISQDKIAELSQMFSYKDF